MNRRQSFLFMFALIVAGEAVFGLPFLIARVFRPTLLDVFGITNLQLGTAFSIYGVVAMAAYFPGGLVADRFPARRLLAVALLATSLGGVVYSRIPSLGTLTWLFGFWGVSTILLFWSAMLRATRQWGAEDRQGRAFGLLDGGRGLVGALLATITVAVFAQLLPGDPALASVGERAGALRGVILVFTGVTAIAAVLVWFWVPEENPSEADTNGERFEWSKVTDVLKIPGLWFQAVIVICAYVGYKSTDDFSLYARDGFGMDDVQAAMVGTISFYLRPVAALAAGLLGDRFQSSRIITCCFALLCLTAGGIGFGLLPAGVTSIFFLAVASTATAIYALRGVYFALFGEGAIPRAFTGTAIGLVSVVGYMPDIFMGPLMGFLTDRTPGPGGHEDLFLAVSLFAVVGLLATLGFRRASARRRSALEVSVAREGSQRLV